MSDENGEINNLDGEINNLDEEFKIITLFNNLQGNFNINPVVHLIENRQIDLEFKKNLELKIEILVRNEINRLKPKKKEEILDILSTVILDKPISKDKRDILNAKYIILSNNDLYLLMARLGYLRYELSNSFLRVAEKRNYYSDFAFKIFLEYIRNKKVLTLIEDKTLLHILSYVLGELKLPDALVNVNYNLIGSKEKVLRKTFLSNYLDINNNNMLDKKTFEQKEDNFKILLRHDDTKLLEIYNFTINEIIKKKQEETTTKEDINQEDINKEDINKKPLWIYYYVDNNLNGLYLSPDINYLEYQQDIISISKILNKDNKVSYAVFENENNGENNLSYHNVEIIIKWIKQYQGYNSEDEIESKKYIYKVNNEDLKIILINTSINITKIL
jgi:hypothetical protein